MRIRVLFFVVISLLGAFDLAYGLATWTFSYVPISLGLLLISSMMYVEIRELRRKT